MIFELKGEERNFKLLKDNELAWNKGNLISVDFSF